MTGLAVPTLCVEITFPRFFGFVAILPGVPTFYFSSDVFFQESGLKGLAMAATELPTPGKFDSGHSASAQGRPGAIRGQIGQKKIANPHFLLLCPLAPYWPFKGPCLLAL